jgi:hypothetical protein
MKCRKRSEASPSGRLNRLPPVVQVDHALVQVHRAARLALHRLGHEGGVHLVADRHLAHRALEAEHLVGARQRVAMVEVDLHLRRAHLVHQRVDLDALRLAPVVHDVEDVAVLVDRLDREALHAGLAAPGAAGRRLQRDVLVGLDLHEVELHLGCDHRAPALGLVELEDAAQHVARRQVDRRAVEADAVVDDLRRRLLGPGHQAQRAGIGHEPHVGVGDRGEVLLRVVAGHRHRQHRLRQAQAEGRVVPVTRHDLAACLARHVGRQALDLVDAVFVEPALDRGGVGHGRRRGAWEGRIVYRRGAPPVGAMRRGRPQAASRIRMAGRPRRAGERGPLSARPAA